jgi:hypothetical protein
MNVYGTGGAYSLWGPLTLLPIFAVVLALASVQERLRFPRLAGQLRDCAGAGA